MIDYVKMKLIGVNKEWLLNHPNLEFKINVSKKTGELDYKEVAEYHFCKITIYDSGLILFSGSIHKMWNSINNIKRPDYLYHKKDKGFNGNSYSLYDVYFTIKHLESLFGCSSNQMVIQNIEFGVNCSLDFCPSLYVKGLKYHHNKLFEFRYNRSYAEVIHQRYILKIYNKSKQYGMKKKVLRAEIKIKKMIELKTLGIKSFSDINRESLDKAFNMLLKRFDEIIHYDKTINIKNLSVKQNNWLLKYQNSYYWIDELKPNLRDFHKRKLKKITSNNSGNLQLKIRQSLIREFVIINRSYIGIINTKYNLFKGYKRSLIR